MNKAQQTILNNLAGRVYPVNMLVAVDGVPADEVNDAIAELISSFKIHTVKQPFPGRDGQYVRGQYFTLYRSGPDPTMCRMLG